jgi:SAM-dependent methyltransferase
LPGLADAYAAGGGVSWAGFGADARTAQAEMNRPWFERELPGVLAGQGELHQKLSRPGARIADVGCGAGWSTIALAMAYPAATLVGLDIDQPSIGLALENVKNSPATSRIDFTLADAAELPASGPFDVIFAFECLHDMPDPVRVLAKSKQALRPGGVMVIMDEASADSFTPNGDLVERLLYGWSITICLPDSLSHPGSVATGTVMRTETLRKYATAAGFDRVEILPTGEFGLWRFYQLSSVR